MFSTSWSSHCATIGTSALKARRCVVAQVVAVAAAELVAASGRPSPTPSSTRLRQSSRRPGARVSRDRPVGVDHVAGVDEQVRLGGAHRVERAHAAVRFVDAPALPADVAAPDDPHRRRRPRRRPERAAHRLAELAAPRLEARLVDDALARRQAVRSSRAVKSARRDVGADTRSRAPASASRRAVADAQPRRPVGAAPDDRAIELDVAALHAGGDHRPGAGVADDGRAAAPWTARRPPPTAAGSGGGSDAWEESSSCIGAPAAASRSRLLGSSGCQSTIVVIVGAGPAGLATSIAAKGHGLELRRPREGRARQHHPALPAEHGVLHDAGAARDRQPAVRHAVREADAARGAALLPPRRRHATSCRLEMGQTGHRR